MLKLVDSLLVGCGQAGEVADLPQELLSTVNNFENALDRRSALSERGHFFSHNLVNLN